MYDAQIIREQWNKKYSTAAKAFIIVSGLYVLIFIGVGFAMNKISDSAPHVLERTIGLSAALGGMTLVVGTGLIKKWRWAAMVATLWCLTLIVGSMVAIATSDPTPPRDTKNTPAYQRGRDVGAGCPGIVTLIMLFACGRAALAKRPREEEEVLDIDPDLRADFDRATPYGFAAPVVQRKQPTVAYVTMAIGAVIALGGAGLFTKALFDEDKAAEIRPEQWQVYRGNGFSIEFPGTPKLQINTIPNMVLSESLELQTSFHMFEVVHYRLPPDMYVRDGGLHEEVNDVLSNLNVQSEFTGSKSLYDKRVREPFRGRNDDRVGIVYGLTDNNDVYIIIVQAEDERGKAVCERFVNSFKRWD